jgi:hypothetical protein
MGAILKFVLYFFLISWIIRSVMRFLAGGLFGTSQQRTAQGNQQQAPPKNDGRIHVEYAPKDGKKKNSDNFKGGEYIDYEEVK